MNSMLISDAYKQSHIYQYPEGTELVYSNWTPRSDAHANIKGGVVVFGIQAALIKITNMFDVDFFHIDEDQAVYEFSSIYKNYFGEEPDVRHIRALHQLGYLPIKAMALPEGTICPIGVPMLTMWNTLPKFYWVTNFLETIMSTELWLPMTSATIARGYREILERWADITCDDNAHIEFQGHDFSMRGMAGLDAAMASGAAHLLSFRGSDTIPAVDYLATNYEAEPEFEMVACSIPATEHSVMCMGTKGSEIDTFIRLITKTYPKGLVSIVSDTWDLWKVVTEYLPQIKDYILERDGQVVIRPDSGDPADIICGTVGDTYHTETPQEKGVIQLLWETFGGTINEKGYKVLDPHIGAIYGDSITPERADDICDRLARKGFASSNIVLGIGSFTYQFNTRDTYGFAMKATYGEVNSEPREIFKDPITDDGVKKSLKGLISVDEDGGVLVATDQSDWYGVISGAMKQVYFNGELTNIQTFDQIREKLWGK